MGIRIFGTSSCSVDDSARAVGNPDPRRFVIVRVVQFNGSQGSATCALVRYPDARNYEGLKVMVYRCGREHLFRQSELDPHFCDDGSHLSPLARFAPTPEGWLAATFVTQALARQA